MKNKKIMILFFLLLIIIFISGFFAIKYLNQKQSGAIVEEYIPEEEISDEQLRNTIVSLYFQDKDTKELSPEARLIDINQLMNTPYETLVNLLIEGPKNDKLEKVIPNDTKILKVYMENDCAIIDLSKEFLNYDKTNEKTKYNLVNSIVNTLTELTEVNKVKILIEGGTNEEFKDIYIRIK